MGTVFRPVITRPLPAGAEIVVGRDGERTAKWRSAHGLMRTAPVRTTPRGDCIVIESSKYLARFRDGGGVVQTIATGCKDLMAARAMLADFEKRAELVRAGVLTPTQDAMSTHRRAPVAQHIHCYISSLRTRGITEKHCRGVRRRITEMFDACGFRSLRDINRDAVEKWIGTDANLKRSARTKNTFTIAAKAFLNWCVEMDRMPANPLTRVPRFDESLDRRRQPRAFSGQEMVRLIDAARRRPLAEAQKYNRGWRKNQNGARLRPETRAKLERLGLERALILKTLLLSGLRLGELASIRVCDVVGDHIVLDARNEKNRRGSTIPLRPDLAADLRSWIGNRRDGLLFRITPNHVKILNRDLKFAGIAKRDERGRTACVHSLRHSLASLLSRGGVAARTAQAAMRHSTIDTTMRHYVDPKLLDVAGALSTLPDLSIAFPPSSASARSEDTRTQSQGFIL